MRPGQMPMGMPFDDDASLADMGVGMGMGNPYAAPMRGRGMRPPFIPPRRRDAGAMDLDAMLFEGGGLGMNRRGRGRGRQSRQRELSTTDDLQQGAGRRASGRRGWNGREGSYNARAGRLCM
jgi:hypothetical protein